MVLCEDLIATSLVAPVFPGLPHEPSSCVATYLLLWAGEPPFETQEDDTAAQRARKRFVLLELTFCKLRHWKITQRMRIEGTGMPVPDSVVCIYEARLFTEKSRGHAWVDWNKMSAVGVALPIRPTWVRK